MSELEQTLSAVATIARNKAIRDADDAGRPQPSEAELDAIGKRADALNVYGYNAVQNRDGTWIPQGIGSPGHETGNHFASIRRYQGEAKYQAAVRKMWKENPERARKIGLEQPERASA